MSHLGLNHLSRGARGTYRQGRDHVHGRSRFNRWGNGQGRRIDIILADQIRGIYKYFIGPVPAHLGCRRGAVYRIILVRPALFQSHANPFVGQSSLGAGPGIRAGGWRRCRFSRHQHRGGRRCGATNVGCRLCPCLHASKIVAQFIIHISVPCNPGLDGARRSSFVYHVQYAIRCRRKDARQGVPGKHSREQVKQRRWVRRRQRHPVSNFLHTRFRREGRNPFRTIIAVYRSFGVGHEDQRGGNRGNQEQGEDRKDQGDAAFSFVLPSFS